MSRSARRWWVPEVIQTSAMDCGPAALKAVLDGFGVDVHLGLLREACQTSVDGTQVHTLEQIARQLGLRTLQTIIPADMLHHPEVLELPAIAVVEQPDRSRHFVVLWRRLGPWVQVMDPAHGRRWVRWSTLVPRLYVHHAWVTMETWQRWSRSPALITGLGTRLLSLGLSEDEAGDRMGASVERPMGLAELDAAARVVDALRQTGALRRGAAARDLLDAVVGRLVAGDQAMVPHDVWTARLEEHGEVMLRGAVLLALQPGDEVARPAQPELAAALAAPTARPMRQIWALMHELEPWAPVWAVAGAALSGASGVVQAMLLRAMVDAERWLQVPAQRLAGFGVLMALVALMGALGAAQVSLLARLGRRLELRLRLLFHHKLPRLSDRYFSSRLTSDLAERAHAAAALRALPGALVGVVGPVVTLACTLAGLVVLDRAALAPAALAALAAVVLPLVIHPLLASRELRRQSFDGTLARTWLDAMQGAVPVRTHGAQDALRREHEEVLTGWLRAGRDALWASLAASTAQALVGAVAAVWLVSAHLDHAEHAGAVLLLIWWATRLPEQGEAVGRAARALPALQGVAARVLEPLDAPEEVAGQPAGPDDLPAWRGPLSLRLRGVTVARGGRAVLQRVDLDVAPGEHVAIVGRSGAGKSSLLALWLGWLRAEEGEIEVSGVPLVPELLAALRRRTAWVDPGVRLWNSSLLHNLRYGHEDDRLDAVLTEAGLDEVLAALPEGLQTRLGEGGGLLSGGQGQRVRLGRAWGRGDAGLVLLDEPMRGLDHEARRALLARARARWAAATLLVVTHDVLDTEVFPRVLVVQDGHIVEDGPPAELLARPDGHLRRLAEHERAARTLLQGPGWRRWRVAQGTVEGDT